MLAGTTNKVIGVACFPLCNDRYHINYHIVFNYLSNPRWDTWGKTENRQKTDAVIPGPTVVVNVVSTALAYRHSTRLPSSGNELVYVWSWVQICCLHLSPELINF